MACREAEFGDPLTGREADIRDGLCEGKTVVEICRDLGICDGTARYYVPRVYKKLGARNAQDLVRIVLTERFNRSREIAPVELIAASSPSLIALIKAGTA